MSDTSPTPNPTRQSGRDLHRHEVRWHIWFPFILAVLVVLAIGAVVALPADNWGRVRAQAIADFMCIFTLLCPMVLCLLPVYLLVVVMVWGAGKLHDGVQQPLERVETMTERMAKRVDEMTQQANQRVVSWSSRLAPFLDLITWFERDPQSEADNERKSSS